MSLNDDAKTTNVWRSNLCLTRHAGLQRAALDGLANVGIGFFFVIVDP
jgi:hypothetical protein